VCICIVHSYKDKNNIVSSRTANAVQYLEIIKICAKHMTQCYKCSFISDLDDSLGLNTGDSVRLRSLNHTPLRLPQLDFIHTIQPTKLKSF